MTQLALLARPSVLPTLHELGEEASPYRKTFAFEGEFINAEHRAIATLPVEGGLIRIRPQGYLRPADALALYELAYGCAGDVLEMGSAWGLSTTFLCRAVRNAGRAAMVYSIEFDEGFQRATAQAIAEQGLQRHHRVLPGEAGAEAERLIACAQQFGLVFVDHDHAYEPTRRACRQLRALLHPGGLALFHDFIDVRNRTEPLVYGVHRAVKELAEDGNFDYLGAVGCCAVLRRRP